MVGATGIEPVTPTMSTQESLYLYVHNIVFKRYPVTENRIILVALNSHNLMSTAPTYLVAQVERECFAGVVQVQ